MRTVVVSCQLLFVSDRLQAANMVEMIELAVAQDPDLSPPPETDFYSSDVLIC